ncbi:MAG: ABC transporter ATP-binding protein [Candidatus Verstraetearchaeota archaeon]|nr:ABC transporter ATP-binding protein [Candidatus Verstraetearchaeota archaeon]
MGAVVAESLSKKFDSFTAVESVSFEIGEGEVFGLLGPNGAGKTTTIRMLACIISPTSGTASVCGSDIRTEPTAVRRKVGIQTESPSLYERLTAVENLEFFAKAYGMTDQSAIRARIKELLEFFDLWDRREEKVAVFSKGMKQKLAIARAIIHRPPALFLDEPTSGLDPEAAKLIRDLIVKLSRLERRTILLSTHRLEDAERICDRVGIISRGRLVVTGTPENLRIKAAGEAKVEVMVNGSASGYAGAIEGLPGVSNLAVEGNKIVVGTRDPVGTTPEVVRRLVGAGAQILAVRPYLPSLEETYLRLMGETAG